MPFEFSVTQNKLVVKYFTCRRDTSLGGFRGLEISQVGANGIQVPLFQLVCGRLRGFDHPFYVGAMKAGLCVSRGLCSLPHSIGCSRQRQGARAEASKQYFIEKCLNGRISDGGSHRMFTILLRKPFSVPIFLSTNSIEPQCARQQTAAAAAAVRREAAAPGATIQL